MSFFDMFGPMFDPESGPNRSQGQRANKSGNDDPIILNVETDGDNTARSSANMPPRGPSGPRITRQPNRPRKSSNGNKILIGVVLALAIIIGLFFGLAQFITDVMWYAQLGFQSVIWTQLGTRVGLWVAYALLIAAVGFLSASLAIWARPDAADGSTIRINGDTIEVGKGVSSKSARRVAVVISLIVGLMFGSQFNANWSEILLMFNAQSFGTTDPQFGIDNGFYVFVLPGLKLIMSAVSLLLLAGIIFSIVTHVMMGGIRITMPVHGRGLFHITKRARRQIGIWLMLNMFAWATNQVLGVFSHLTQEGSRITGATYTTVNATIPVTFIMAAITVILGVILGVWIMKSHALEGQAPIAVRASEALKAWKVPTVAIASAIVVSLVLTVAWPMLLQRFRVNPNAQEMESTYIQRNIDATREAYGLNNVKTEQYQATTEGEAGALADSAESTAQIRLLDPQIVSPTFKQLQQSKQYYTFADTLAVDKYEVDGVSQDTVIAARELDLAGLDQFRDLVHDGLHRGGGRDLGDLDHIFAGHCIVAGAHLYAAAAILVNFTHLRFIIHDLAAAHKVRGGHGGADIVVLVLHQCHGGGAQLRQIEGTDVAGHAHRNAQRVVGQNGGEGDRQQGGLGGGAVVVGHKVHGFLVDIPEQLLAHAFQLCLGVTGSGAGHIAAVRLAKVTLAVHKGHQQALVAAAHAHHGVVDGGVAVGVQVHGAAHDVGAFGAGAFQQAHAVHGIQQFAVGGLEAVNFRQRAGNNNAHGVRHVVCFQRIGNGAFDDLTGREDLDVIAQLRADRGGFLFGCFFCHFALSSPD